MAGMPHPPVAPPLRWPRPSHCSSLLHLSVPLVLPGRWALVGGPCLWTGFGGCLFPLLSIGWDSVCVTHHCWGGCDPAVWPGGTGSVW